MPRSYVGPLLDPIDREQPLEIDECPGDWAHSGAAHFAINQICLGQRVRLTRRRMSPSIDEMPGVVEGHCYGSSHHADGHQIVLAIELDNGECVGVDVSNPGDWHWTVS